MNGGRRVHRKEAQEAQESDGWQEGPKQDGVVRADDFSVDLPTWCFTSSAVLRTYVQQTENLSLLAASRDSGI